MFGAMKEIYCIIQHRFSTANKLDQNYQIVHLRLGIHVKVKCTLVQALRLCTGRTTHRGSRGIALLFLDHGTRRG